MFVYRFVCLLNTVMQNSVETYLKRRSTKVVNYLVMLVRTDRQTKFGACSGSLQLLLSKFQLYDMVDSIHSVIVSYKMTNLGAF